MYFTPPYTLYFRNKLHFKAVSPLRNWARGAPPGISHFSHPPPLYLGVDLGNRKSKRHRHSLPSSSFSSFPELPAGGGGSLIPIPVLLFAGREWKKWALFACGTDGFYQWRSMMLYKCPLLKMKEVSGWLAELGFIFLKRYNHGK